MRQTGVILLAMLAMAAVVWLGRGEVQLPSWAAAPVMKKNKPATVQVPVARVKAPEYSGLQSELKGYLDQTEGEFAVFVMDLASGASFDINGDKPMHPASTIKLPVVLYVHREVAEGRARWDQRVAYKRALHFREGSGILQMGGRDGDSYSLRTLVNLAITVSDNIAYEMLVRHVGRERLHAFMWDIGGRTVFPEGRTLSTAKDMGAYLKGVVDFSARHPGAGALLLQDMEHSIYNDGIPRGVPDGVRVAHKQGMLSNAANDAAIVFGQRPFVLVVFSSKTGVKKGFDFVAEVTRRVYAFHAGLPAAEVPGIGGGKGLKTRVE